MTSRFKMMRKFLSGGTALQVTALMGAGLSGSTILNSVASAQEYTTGSIVGSVKTDTGDTVSSGSVNVTSDEQGFSRTATVQSDGSFRIPQLPTGAYTVVVTPTSGQTVTAEHISVTAGSSVTYIFTIPTGSTASGSDIVVTGHTVKGNDFASTTSGLTVDVQQLTQNVPINRNATALILLAPGATSGDSGFGNFASIGGASVSENQYYVNGLNITDFRNFIAPSRVPFEFYRTYNVQTGGLTAEYGRALGGVTNAVTKSGTNEFKAGAIFAFSPDFGSENGKSTYLENNTQRYRQTYDTTFYVSGPIIKNHLFFYGLYNPQHSESSDSYTQNNQRLFTTVDTPFLGAKIDAVITDTQRVEFTYFRDRTKTGIDYFNYNGATGVTGTAQGHTDQTTGGDNFVATYTGNFTKWFTLSGSYGQNRRVNDLLPAPNTAVTYSLLPAAGEVLANGFSSSAQANSDIRKVYRVDADIYAHILGDHHFRVGYDNEDLTSVNNVFYTGTGYYYILYPTYIRRYLYQNVGNFESKQDAYYLQDSWTIGDRLNLQLGVRNDHFKNYDANGAAFFDQKNQWAPRVGASFDVFGDKRTKISAYFGRYFQPLATNTNIREAGKELYYRQYFNYPAGVSAANFNATSGIPVGLTFDAAGNPMLGTPRSDTAACPASASAADRAIGCNLITSDGTVHAANQLIAQGLKPSYSDEIKAGISQQFKDWTFGLNYIHRTLGRTLEDIAVDAGVIAYCNAHGIAGCADAYSGFRQYVVSNPGNDVTVVPLINVNGQLGNAITLKAADLGYPKPVRKYDSFQFTFDKPFNGKWGLSGSYTYTHLVGNYEGSVDSTINQTDTGITEDFDQPGLLVGAYGDLANGRSHEIKAFGSYRPFTWLTLGANASVASPRKFSCIGNYPDPNNFAYAYGSFSYFCQQASAANGSPITYTDPSSGVTRTAYLVPRGTAFQSDWYKQLDVKIQADIRSLPGTSVALDVFNIFNWQDKLDFNEFGDLDNGGTNPQYKQVTNYTTPRSIRVTLTVRFGEHGDGGTGTSTETSK